MARYIDADALIKKIYPMGIGDGKYAINAGAVKFAIDNAPTADVVPKSEVDELKKDRYQVLPDGRIELLPRTDIEKIKTDVAREIFEEIEKITMHNVTSSYGIWLMSMGEDAFAELKKKYIKGD